MRLIPVDILSSAIENGEVRVTVGNAATKTGFGADATMWMIDGFYSMPNDPDDDGACMALMPEQGNSRWIMGTKDNRITDRYGDMAPGDRAIVTQGDARILVKKSNDSVSVMTKNHAANDELMVMQLNGATGELTVMIGGSDGTAMFKMKSGKIAFAVDGGGSLMIDKNGVNISGKHFGANTSGGNIGVLPGGAAPIAPANSILFGLTGMTGAPAPKWTISPA